MYTSPNRTSVMEALSEAVDENWKLYTVSDAEVGGKVCLHVPSAAATVVKFLVSVEVLGDMRVVTVAPGVVKPQTTAA